MANFECDLHTCEFTHDRTKEHLLHHITNKITTHLRPTDIGLLPRRQDFQSPTLMKLVEEGVKRKEPLWFMPHTAFDYTETVIDGRERSRVYRLYITGILPDSSRATLVVSGIDVCYGLSLPNGSSRGQFRDLIVSKMVDAGINYTDRKWVQLRKERGFHEKQSDWLMISFPDLSDRTKFRNIISKYNEARKGNDLPEIETCEDDASNYFALIARKHGFNTASWNQIDKYTVGSPADVRNMKYLFHINIGELKPISSETVNARIAKRDEWGEALSKGRIIVATWDIETYSRVQNGVIPEPGERNYNVFALCTAYAWHANMPVSMLVGYVDVAARVKREHGMVVFICGTEKATLKAWTDGHARMNPDMTSAFNGGNFDWPITQEKMRRYGLLSGLSDALRCDPRPKQSADNILKWNFSTEKIKIDAENNHDLKCVAKFPGLIDIDMLPTMLKMYPRAEVPKLASLNFFLSKMGLESKEDMPYKRMFKIYERAAKLASIKECHCSEDEDGNVCTAPIKINVTMGEYSYKTKCDCDRHVREIDYVPDPALLADKTCEDPYTDELHPEIDGRCCYCTKRERNLDDMGDVVYYCGIDCVRPHQLCVKRLVVMDKRELSTLAFVSLWDSFYRADGMKVRNLIGNCAAKFGIAFTNKAPDVSDSDKTHYPGAWVGLPERRLNREDPVSGVDYASLYPSLMMTYNLSIDMVVYTKERAAELEKQGYNLHHIGPFTYEKGEKKGAAGNRKFTAEGWMVRHNGILEPSRDKKIVTTYRRKAIYKKGGEVVKTVYDDECVPPRPGALVPTTAPPEYSSDTSKIGAPDIKTRRFSTNIIVDNAYDSVSYSYEPVYGRDPLPGERMGLFPYVLRQLFELRKPVKALYLHYFDLIEQMEKNHTREIFCKIANAVLGFDEVEYNMNYIDAKQKAIKVLANTFYGESGNFRSPVFEILCAAGTTTAGVANITRVRLMVQRLGCHVHYGDTDSLYLSPPRRLFRDLRMTYEQTLAVIDSRFGGESDAAGDGVLARMPQSVLDAKTRADARTAARLIYWEAKVRRTMIYMNELVTEISLFLMKNNGTLFLNMAYEEVGLPHLFAGMKKYIMAAHMKTINFYPKTYMTRGLEYTKQGQTEFAAMINPQILRSIMIPDNEKEPLELICEIVQNYKFNEIEIDKLALKAKHKPEKKNIPVKIFIERMRTMLNMYADDLQMTALYKLPEPGDKFTYIMAKKDIQYDMRGRKHDPTKGEKMEFLRVYKMFKDNPDSAIEIDIDWYVKKSFLGVFARYIAYEDQFQPPAGMYDATDREGYKALDKASIKNTVTFLEKIYDNRVGFVKGAAAAVGRGIRASYNRAAKAAKTALTTQLGEAGALYNKIASAPLEKALGATLCEMAKVDPPHIDGTKVALGVMEQMGGDPWKVWHYYAAVRGNTSVAIRQKATNAQIKDTEREICRLAPRITASARNTSATIAELASASTNGGVDVTDYSDESYINRGVDLDAVKEMYALYTKLRALEGVRLTLSEIVSVVMTAKSGGEAVKPEAIIKKGVRSFAREEAREMSKKLLPEYEWQ